MKYLCLVYAGESAFEGMDARTKYELDRDSLAYDRELAEAGHFIAAEALDAPTTAQTVRMRNGRVSTTDGPFAETKEHLAGFILIEARDLNEAVRIAGNIPMARYSAIEVRPILQIVPVPV